MFLTLPSCASSGSELNPRSRELLVHRPRQHAAFHLNSECYGYQALQLEHDMQLARSLLTLVLLATAVASTPTALRVNSDTEYPLRLDSDDFDLNLQEMRLVQMAPDAQPVWMTELEKVVIFLPS